MLTALFGDARNKRRNNGKLQILRFLKMKVSNHCTTHPVDSLLISLIMRFDFIFNIMIFTDVFIYISEKLLFVIHSKEML